MSLDAAFTIARSGLRHIDRQLARTANDIANAEVAGHSRTTLPGTSAEAGGAGIGVRTGVVARDIDAALLTATHRAQGDTAGAALSARLLGGVEAAHGNPDSGGSVAGRISGLRDAYIALQEAPADANRRAAALEAAQALTRQVRDVATAIGSARQEAHDTLVQDVAALNGALNQVARLNDEIRREIAAGRSVATLEDQRDLSLGRIAEVLEVRALRGSDGQVTLVARGGIVLPLHETGAVFSLAPATLGPATHAGAGLPGVMLGGQDVTARLAGGRIGAALTARDADLPRMQAELDLVAAEVAQRFAGQGLRLFTDGAGAVPDTTQPYTAGGQLGFAQVMQVNDAVVADPTLLRDGTDAVVGLPGGPTAFTPNPPGGPAGFEALVTRILDHALGTTQAAGVAQGAIATTGLGPAGTLTSRLGGFGSVESYAAAVVAEHAAMRTAATGSQQSGAALVEVLEGRMAERSGVDVDTEMAAMVELQSAYGLNARVMATVQAMWDSLFAAVR
jgi:flagellar hook-associated protein 1 FlgK